jgi:hypothetical protein
MKIDLAEVPLEEYRVTQKAVVERAPEADHGPFDAGQENQGQAVLDWSSQSLRDGVLTSKLTAMHASMTSLDLRFNSLR